MGDIVESGKAESTKELHRKFNRGVAKFNKKYGDEIVSPLTITLGDEFQGLVDRLSNAFNIMHETRLHFLGQNIKTRFVLGRAFIKTRINPEKAWNMMGPGLAEARKRLNDKSDPSAYRFSFGETPVLENNLNAMGYVLTDIEDGWTETQRDYVLYVFANEKKKLADIAEKLNVSERNIYKVLKAAKMSLYERQLDAVRSTLAHLDGGE